MSPSRLPALILFAACGVPAAGQDAGPSAILGDPGANRLGLDPLLDPLLGTPDQPFRPFAPLGPPPVVEQEGIGTRFGLGILAGYYGIPGYGVTWMPTEQVSGQPTSLSLVRQDLSIFAPIYRDGCDTAAVGLGIRNTLFTTGAILPDSKRPFPAALWDIQAGVAYSHRWENGWTTGAVVSGGSASNRPFLQSEVLVASLALYNVFPVAEADAWILGARYSPTADTPYPLPIVAYYWKPSPDLEMTVGLPTYIRWQFAPQWSFEGLYVPIRTVSGRITWAPPEVPEARIYAAFNWANESYFLTDRPDLDQRLYAYEKRITGGLTIDLPWQLRMDLSGGYVFDRFYFQGRQYSDQNNDRVNVGSGVFLSFQLRLQF